MKGTSACPPRRIIRAPSLLYERLRELHTVSVRVEDVDEPHLSRQLQDDAHVDVLPAQALGLGLHVAHVDCRDAALRVRLSLGERDPHVAVLELRPAVVPVDEPATTENYTLALHDAL